MLKRYLLSHVHYSTICGQDVESVVCIMDGWSKKHSVIYTVEYYVQWKPVIYTRRTHIEGNKQKSERQIPHVLTHMFSQRN